MADSLDQGARNWHKSSRSATENECVECGEYPADATGDVAVRDTKRQKHGPVLSFTTQAWGSFIADIKRNDRLSGRAL
ncbi:DUF397 domain-containing protein [Streptomyces sp. CG1]|uniref:DUF397 domain-containing protein n=1 Tax=Streptomyces sp. CG1 TaxID=1287523 RepID=UPI0034E19B97